MQMGGIREMPRNDPKDLQPPVQYKERRVARQLTKPEINAAADRAETRAMQTHDDRANSSVTKPRWIVDLMKRRAFIAGLGSATAWPIVAKAEQPVMPVIGFLSSASADGYKPFVAAYRNGLNEAGFVEGRNIAIEFRWAEGQYDRLPSLADELVRLPVALVVASGGLPSVAAAKAKTTTIPIVFTLGSDPVKFGIVASLSRPGGNITGVSLLAYLLDAKRVDLLHALLPNAAVDAATLLRSPTRCSNGSLI
jgi:ABC transporter substrate binding protein